MLERLRGWLEWIGGHGWAVLLALLLIVAAVWGFIEVAEEVGEGETQTFDEWALHALRTPGDLSDPLGPPWLHEVGRDITAVGGVAVLTLATLAVVGYLILTRKYHAMWLVIVATIGAMLISSGLKELFGRERPDIVPHLSIVHSPSFPSGHAMLSTAVYLTLGTLLAGLVKQRIVQVYFLTLALVLAAMVGISRVYMGVHYPTDVLAGWMAGLAWALLCWIAARYLRRTGQVETVDTAPEPAEPAFTETA